jgi:hypothetical protein
VKRHAQQTLKERKKKNARRASALVVCIFRDGKLRKKSSVLDSGKLQFLKGVNHVYMVICIWMPQLQ